MNLKVGGRAKAEVPGFLTLEMEDGEHRVRGGGG